jgi:hypothetical protein
MYIRPHKETTMLNIATIRTLAELKSITMKGSVEKMYSGFSRGNGSYVCYMHDGILFFFDSKKRLISQKDAATINNGADPWSAEGRA